MSWEAQYTPLIDADIAKLTPLHDFVLVKPMPPADLVLRSPIHQTKDYRWRSNRPTGLQYGTVVAAGKGDRLIGMFCPKCIHGFLKVETAKTFSCPKCRKSAEPLVDCVNGRAYVERADMHCKIGDVVIYPRVPANDVEINGELYTFLHLEQHVLAVCPPDDVDLAQWDKERHLAA